MNKNIVLLSTFRASFFNKGASFIIIIIWYFINVIFIKSSLCPFIRFKVLILKMFGASIGNNIVIKNNVNIKFPWKLKVGNNVWIGENVWIDNLDNIIIEDNVCISQGAMLLTGNHDYTSTSFDYKNAPITLKSGSWIGAKSIVCPGVTINSHAILTVGSIATKDLNEYSIYQGNPAKKIRERVIK